MKYPSDHKTALPRGQTCTCYVCVHPEIVGPAQRDYRAGVIALLSGMHDQTTGDRRAAYALTIRTIETGAVDDVEVHTCPECGGTGTVEDDATGALNYHVQRKCPACK